MQKLAKTLLLILLTAASGMLSAAPMAYSINSDSGTNDSDGLYLIDLATGNQIERIGTVQSVLLNTRIDVEGLAFAPDGRLFGIDDESLKLFQISLENALVDPDDDYFIEDLTKGGNDFGMTFACDENLYVTSVTRQSLYRLELDGTVDPVLIGAEGGLGANISALAAYGNPVRLYGLGNGTAGENAAAAPILYEIDVTSGAATEIGPLGAGVGQYAEGGLAFDAAGQLWAITDRRPVLMPSQVMRINTTTGAASDIRDTVEEGFESLAISPPRGCQPIGNGEYAAFVVQKRFEDGNDTTPVQLNISCTTGHPLEQSLTVLPNEGAFGRYEVRFVVDSFDDGTLNCEVWEDAPDGYTAEYDCRSGTSCATASGSGPCSFTGVKIGQEDVCLIHNRVNPVEVTVTKEWLYEHENQVIDEQATIDLYCSNVFGGDGEILHNGLMFWSWLFEGSPASQVATVYPNSYGLTECWTKEHPTSSAVESVSNCSQPISINPGDDGKSCAVINTVFFEGIPTLSQYGMILFTALMLLSGLIAVRRFG
jgi:hypothetical protein